MKKTNSLYLLLFGLLSLNAAGVWAEENLLQNGSFEENGTDHWRPDTWQQLEGSLTVETVPSGKDGRYAVSMDSSIPEDSKLVQTVKVKPRTLYRLSGWIYVESDITGAKGANLSVLDITDTSQDVKEPGGGWVYRELYGKTGKKQKELSVTLRIGGYGSLAEGKALFDDIRLEKVGKLPAGVSAVLFYPRAAPSPDKNAGGSSVPGMLLWGMLYVIMLGLLFSDPVRKYFEGAYAKRLLIVLTAAAVILRYVIAAAIPGHSTDIVCFKAWSSELFSAGIPHFYASESFKDYPPLYMYILYLVGALRTVFGLPFDSPAFLLLVKTPAILADIATAYLLLRLTKRKTGNLIFAAFLFNPGIIMNSAAYGQVDSVFTLAIALMCIAFYRGKFVRSAAFLGAALAFKPQGFVFAAVGACFLLLYLLGRLSFRIPPLMRFAARFHLDLACETEQNGVSGSRTPVPGKTVLLSIATAAGVYAVSFVPFFILHPGEYAALYSRIFSSYPYASVNAFNLFSLFGGNWKPVTWRFMGLQVRYWNSIAAVLTALFAFFVFLANKEKVRPFAAVLLLAVLSFTFMAHIHERYLYPAVFPAAALFLISGRKQYLYLFVTLSLLLFLNQGIVLFESMKQVFQIPSGSFILKAGSLFMCGAAVWTVLLVLGKDFPRLSAKASGQREKAAVDSGKSLMEHNRQLRFTRSDLLICTLLVLFFGAISFFNLGRWVSPQTFWQPKAKDAVVQAQLEHPSHISEIGYFSGLGTGSYEVLVSSGGDQFIHLTDIENTNPYAEFKWQALPVDADASHIRLRVTKPGFTLYEVVIRNGDAEIPLSYEGSASTGSTRDAEHLFDEQDTYPDALNYKSGMYFDEIYYPRSAVQYLQGKRLQETTHPELGKLIMAGAVKVFGLRPFVWRMPGVLAGILMLPVLYLLSRRLLFRRDAAILIVILFGFDFMRFTQTRIATIDSFSVMFILFMYLFMARCFFTSYDGINKKSLWRLGWPVLASGLAFGFGAADKWTSLFAGFGLAVLFFWKLFLILKEMDTSRERLKMAAIAFGWGVLTFILIPGFIYFASFYPLMKIYGNNDLIAFVLKRQTDMYNYHSRLQATHPFSSPWWQWPLIVRPIWYYSGQSHLKSGFIGNIVNMGTPVIWWLGIPSIAYLAWAAVRKRSRAAWFILIAFGSQYFPWISSPRKLIFLYHFFTAVPFMLMATVWSLDDLFEGKERTRRLAGISLIVLAVGLFILFYPVLSGMVVSKAYAAHFLRWFHSWVLFN